MSLLARILLAALALGHDPTPLRVPESLLAITSMPEASGVVWNPTLSRYLVVSDDTGLKEKGTNHAPWIFALSREGVFDETPIPIAGIEKLNDAEALCSGPDDTLFLATSHSENKKGHVKAARRRLFQLTLVGRTLKILGSFDLAGAIVEAGVIPSDSVDIEALSYHGGELYVGLKAPQTASGAAIVLKVRDVLSAMKDGAISAGRISKFADIPLSVEAAAGGGTVTEGISDMGFLPDGSLLILGNSPKKRPPDGGGALWWRKPDGSVVMLRRFLGLKPEGISLSDDKKHIVIVFDNDRKLPLWLHIPIPKTTQAAVPHKKPSQ